MHRELKQSFHLESVPFIKNLEDQQAIYSSLNTNWTQNMKTVIYSFSLETSQSSFKNLKRQIESAFNILTKLSESISIVIVLPVRPITKINKKSDSDDQYSLQRRNLLHFVSTLLFVLGVHLV